MSAAQKIPDANDIDEAIILAAGKTVNKSAANDDIEVISGGISSEIIKAIKKKAAEIVARKVMDDTVQAGLAAALAENDDIEDSLEETSSTEKNTPQVNTQNEGETDVSEKDQKKSEETEKKDETDTDENDPSNIDPDSLPQEALDNFGEDSREEAPENDTTNESEMPAEDDDQLENPLSTDNRATPQETPNALSQKNDPTPQKNDGEPQKNNKSRNDYQNYLNDMNQSGKELDENGNRVHDDAPLSEEDWGKSQNDLPEKENELDESKKEEPKSEQNSESTPKKTSDDAASHPQTPEAQKKSFDPFDEENAQKAEKNPDNVPGGAHHEQAGEKKGDPNKDEEGEEDDNQKRTDGSEYMPPGSAPEQQSKAMQMINKLRYKSELDEINKKIRKLQMEIDYIHMPPIRKLNKEINAAHKKIKKLTRKIVFYSIVCLLFFLLAAIFAMTLVGILLSIPLATQAGNLLIKIGVLAEQRKIEKDNVKPKEKERDEQMDVVKQKRKEIGKLATYRSRLLNKGILGRKPKMN